MVPTNTWGIFAQFMTAGKADLKYLSKGYWKSKKKTGVTTHFLEIFKQQYF